MLYRRVGGHGASESEEVECYAEGFLMVNIKIRERLSGKEREARFQVGYQFAAAKEIKMEVPWV